MSEVSKQVSPQPGPSMMGALTSSLTGLINMGRRWWKKSWKPRSWGSWSWGEDYDGSGYKASKKTNKKKKRASLSQLENPMFSPFGLTGLSGSNFLNNLVSNVDSLVDFSEGDESDGGDAGIDDYLDREILFCSMRSDIVGIQYYRGTVNDGEMVSLVREPRNKYDANAVKVENFAAQQVGHIKREMARALAPIMDNSIARVEGTVPHGAHNVFRMPVDLTFWGKPENRETCLHKLRQFGHCVKEAPVESAGAGVPSTSTAFNLSTYMPKRIFLTPAEMRNELDKLFENLEETDKASQLEPAEAIATQLYPHQKQALHWMVQRESGKVLPPFWEETKAKKYFNSIMRYTADKKPASICGGILADDMGLGKTLEVIALILTNFMDNKPLAVRVDGKIRASRLEKEARIRSYRKGVKMEKAGTVKKRFSMRRYHDGGETSCAKKDMEAFVVADKEITVVDLDTEDSESEEDLDEEEESDDNDDIIVVTGKDDPEFVPKNVKGGRKAKSLPGMLLTSPNVLSRPKRHSSKPVKYVISSDDDDDDDDDDGESQSGDKISKKDSKNSKQTDQQKASGESIPTKSMEAGHAPPSREFTGVSGQGDENSFKSVHASQEVCEISSEEIDGKPKETISKEKAVPVEVIITDPATSTQSNLETKKSKRNARKNAPVSVAPMSTRPRRHARKPAKYRDSSDEENECKEDDHELPAKKSRLSVVQTKELTTPLIDTCNKGKGKGKGKGKSSAKQATPKKIIMPFKQEVENTVSNVISMKPVTPKKIIMPPKQEVENTVASVIMDTDAPPLPSLDLPDVAVQKTFESKVKQAVGPVLPSLELPDLDPPKTCKSGVKKTIVIDLNTCSQGSNSLPDLEVQDAVKNSPGPSRCGKGSGRTPSNGKPRTTLIVCPLSVLSNWIDQFEDHVHEHVHLEIYTFYGASRSRDPAFLAKQDVVLTTYSTVTADAKTKSGGCLKQVDWLRIVLDEGHTIRNPNAQMTKAICELRSLRKWVLTGTPIQNSIKDLWSLIKFLKIKPFTEKEWWHRTIRRPLEAGEECALKRVQHLMCNISMRRTKTQEINGKKLVQLPARNVFQEEVELSKDERATYEAMQTEGKLIISRYFQQGTLLLHYGQVLAILMRLRQICCHPFLVTKVANEMAKIQDLSEADKLPEELRKKLLDSLMSVLANTDEECSVCLDSMKSPVITPCVHIFCRGCIVQVIETEKTTVAQATCPLCRKPLEVDMLKDVKDIQEQEKEENNQIITPEGPWQSSAKADALMNALLQVRQENPETKSLVVSQFTSFLTVLETPLKAHGFTFTRLDGTMNQKQRTQSIEQFSDPSPGSPTIMLLSLKAGGVGLNLTAASRVFLMDPAWNPAAEEQCFDRAHRLGQTRDVIITKFIVKESVEERMLELQEKKRKLMQGAFVAKQSADQRKQMRINDIKTLMDM